jgi:hypothetical protein
VPIYTFKNNDTGEVFEDMMTITNYETFLADNPHITQELNRIALGDPIRLGLRKPDRAFRDILGNIKKRAGSRGKINTFG